MKPSCVKWSSFVRTSVIASWRMASMEIQSVRLYCLSGRTCKGQGRSRNDSWRLRVHGD